MQSIYTAPGGFRASAAKAGTEQAKTRPLTLTGQGETVRIRLTDAAFETWQSEQDADKRSAILADGKRTVIGTAKVQVPAAAMTAWQTAIRASVDARHTAETTAHAAAVEALPKGEREAFLTANPAPSDPTPSDYVAEAASVLASGLVVIEAAEEDKTDETLNAMFS